ncbi:ATP/GTP-binding protein [Hydrogenophaga sp.]|uniref:GTP-binding protein n=1 Tax=Hydrogenophaga sp. TaxID=1904254 RepID=UPI002723EE04|nr:ATP/GTP-binding protein [Hydrogenophaga sp.]MDO9436913.1 ATP/GTP-binding protein [Hydrogenophaga sp.]
MTLSPSPNALKIVFSGPMGAGKTTAIRAICGGETLSTEVPITGETVGDKVSTTVGLDYGECALSNELTLKLFGTPGQERFSFMWPILGEGAFGLIVLVDNSQPEAMAEVEHYLSAFASHIGRRRMVVGVGRMDSHPLPDIDAYCARLAASGFDVPVIDADVRREADVRLLLSVLVSMAEVEHATGATP